MQTLAVDVWSDIACPWCYIGLTRLLKVLDGFEPKDRVSLRLHSYELNPSAKAEEDGGTYAERLAAKYRVPIEEGEKMISRVCQVAAADGLTFDYGIIRPGNTFDAHRLIHWASSLGAGQRLKSRFFRGYFCEGAAIGSREALVTLASDEGLSADTAREVLASQAYSEDVRADEQEAKELGVSGVPFFLFGEKFAVSGAQPEDVLKSGLLRAQAEP